jgi:murein DD-endopeptidase MepM/ murein hydrolase activator NlpD
MVNRVLFLAIIGFFFANSAFSQIKYAVIPENPTPGEPVTIAVAAYVTKAVLIKDQRQLAKADFFNVPEFKIAILAIPSTVNSGNAVIRLEDENGVIFEFPLTISQREFAAEIIELNPVLTGIRTDPSPQRTNEANLLWQILTTTGNEVYHTGTFIPPVVSTRRTSFFGDRRVFKYSNGTSDTSIHAGVDYGVPTGTLVNACAAGKVVLARNRIVTGNSVVIEHAPGIYSLYYHLDSIKVQEGTFVYAGSLIGLSGSTGLATGPHLHWELRVNTENTDPDAFVSRPIIDKNLLLSKIYN